MIFFLSFETKFYNSFRYRNFNKIQKKIDNNNNAGVNICLVKKYMKRYRILTIFWIYTIILYFFKINIALYINI